VRAGDSRSRKEVNWLKIVALLVGWERLSDFNRMSRASILALEREASLRRTNCGLEVGVGEGVEIVSPVDRVELAGAGERRDLGLADAEGQEIRLPVGSSSLRTSKISRSLIASRHVTHFGTLLWFF